MLQWLYNLMPTRQPAPRVPPEAVAPAPYIGPRMYTVGYLRVPYEEAVPSEHLRWAKILLKDLPLDEGAGYWHNSGHEGIVLQTRFTEEEIADMLREHQGGICVETYNDGRPVTPYRVVTVSIPYSKAERLGLSSRFNIEIRGIA